MPLPLLLPLAIGAAQAIPKVAAAISQRRKANKLTLQNTVPAGFLENLNGLRLAANTARMPGMGAAENRLAQNFAAGAGATTRAGGSSADALAGISALSLQRQQGLGQLATQGAQYQDAAKAHLSAGLNQLGAYQKADQDAFSRNKAALVQSSNQNLMNAVDGAASFAAFALQGGQNSTATADPAADVLETRPTTSLPGGVGNLSLPGALPYYNPTTGPGVGLGNYRMSRRTKQRGIGVY